MAAVLPELKQTGLNGRKKKKKKKEIMSKLEIHSLRP
jgi:hypothetical protein